MSRRIKTIDIQSPLIDRRGYIAEVRRLRQSKMTVNDIADALNLSATAVRNLLFEGESYVPDQAPMIRTTKDLVALFKASHHRGGS